METQAPPGASESHPQIPQGTISTPSTKGRKPAPRRHSKATRELVKRLFWQYWGYDDITREANVAKQTISQWAYDGNWIEKRNQDEFELVSEYVARKAGLMSTISNLSLDLIAGSLKAIKAKGEPLSLTQAKIISDIFAQVDKIIKLDTGQATERREVKQTTVEDLREAIKLDAFLDVTPKEPSGDK